MLTIFIEYRPRLGAAHVFISIDGQSKDLVTLVQNENAITLGHGGQDGEEICRFLWPQNFGKILLSEPGKQLI